VLVVILIALIVVQEMCARLGSATGMGFSELVREHFGVRMTTFVVIALLVANLGTAFSEFDGIGAAAELMHVPRLVAIPIAAVLLWSLVVFGSYRVVERAFLGMALVFVAYPIAAVLAQPDWGQAGRGLIIPRVPGSFGGIEMVIAIIGTTITPYMQLYLTSSVAEKAVRPEDYVYERLDVIAGSVFANLVALAIMVATAATLFQNGTSIDSASDAARALEPVAGPLAEYLFAVGLLGACLLAAPVLALTSAYSVTEAIGMEKGVSQDFRRAPVFMGLFTGMIILAAAGALVPGIPFTSTLLTIQIVDAAVLPVVLYSLLRLTNDRELMGDRTNGWSFNLIGVATAAVVVSLSTLLVGLVVARLFVGARLRCVSDSSRDLAAEFTAPIRPTVIDPSYRRPLQCRRWRFRRFCTNRIHRPRSRTIRTYEPRRPLWKRKRPASSRRYTTSSKLDASTPPRRASNPPTPPTAPRRSPNSTTTTASRCSRPSGATTSRGSSSICLTTAAARSSTRSRRPNCRRCSMRSTTTSSPTSCTRCPANARRTSCAG
jgi:Mn2+/Fe2+ NRAMP family transporter